MIFTAQEKHSRLREITYHFPIQLKWYSSSSYGFLWHNEKHRSLKRCSRYSRFIKIEMNRWLSVILMKEKTLREIRWSTSVWKLISLLFLSAKHRHVILRYSSPTPTKRILNVYRQALPTLRHSYSLYASSSVCVCILERERKMGDRQDQWRDSTRDRLTERE